MLINAIRAENLKTRHSNIWVAVVILPPINCHDWRNYLRYQCFCKFI